MSFDYIFVLLFGLHLQCLFVNCLETVEKLICKSMEVGSRIPHPEFCNIYIVCENDVAKSVICPKNALFNPLSDLCDTSHKICASGLIRNSNGSLFKYKPDIKNSRKATDNGMHLSRNDHTSLSLNPLTCPINDPDQLVFISHPEKCSVYFICYHGKPIPIECSKGLHWSQKHYKCVDKELSECYARSLNQHVGCPPTGMEFLPHDRDCQKFWYCLHGFRMIQQCDAFFHWDVIEKKCKPKWQATCYSNALKKNNL